MAKAWTWPLPKGTGPRRCSIESVTLRRTFGSDELASKGYAEAKHTDVGTEIIQASIVKVDGSPVDQPFTGFEAWNLRTRELVANAFNTINGTTAAEKKLFHDSVVAVVKGGWLFTVPKIANDPHADKRECEITRIVAREITGTEESTAIREGKADGLEDSVSRLLAGVISVDGAPLTADTFAHFSSRARRFLVEAFDHINGSAGVDDFLSGASEEEVEVSTPGASNEEESSEIG